MKLIDCLLFTDENIDPVVTKQLRSKGFDVFDVLENNLGGTDDESLLALAHQQGRIVLTHDSDFGTLVFSQGKPFQGIIYLKPGHIQSEFTIESIDALLEKIEEVTFPFIVVVLHSETGINIRYRQR